MNQALPLLGGLFAEGRQRPTAKEGVEKKEANSKPRRSSVQASEGTSGRATRQEGRAKGEDGATGGREAVAREGAPVAERGATAEGDALARFAKVVLRLPQR